MVEFTNGFPGDHVENSIQDAKDFSLRQDYPAVERTAAGRKSSVGVSWPSMWSSRKQCTEKQGRSSTSFRHTHERLNDGPRSCAFCDKTHGGDLLPSGETESTEKDD